MFAAREFPPACEIPVTSLPSADVEPGIRYDASLSKAQAEPTARWSPATRVAFRFCFIYFGLYVITTQMFGGMFSLPLPIPQIERLAPLRVFFIWVGAHILRLGHPIPLVQSGSGDQLYNWVAAFSLAVVAALATAVWSVVSRRTPHYETHYKWFRLFIRVALGTSMLSYGFAKVIPLQMPILTLTRLVEPFGNFSPMAVLWWSIGASPAYEVFVGSVEVLCGVLLLIPRTSQLGALVCLGAVTQVFALNMTYDVPVKLFAFHLILLCLFLSAPNIRRLYDFFIGHRSTLLLGEPPLGRTERVQRGVVITQLVFCVWSVGFRVYGSTDAWTTYGGGAPRSALFGIWDIEQMAVAGKTLPPVLTDSTRWKRMVFQSPTAASFQRMNDRFTSFGAKIDTAAKTLALTSNDSAKTKSTLTFQRPSPDRLVLDGTLNGQPTHLELKLRDLNSFTLRSRGFNWVQEVPFQR